MGSVWIIYALSNTKTNLTYLTLGGRCITSVGSLPTEVRNDCYIVTIDKQPAINRQVDNFIYPLKLFARSNHTIIRLL